MSSHSTYNPHVASGGSLRGYISIRLILSRATGKIRAHLHPVGGLWTDQSIKSYRSFSYVYFRFGRNVLTVCARFFDPVSISKIVNFTHDMSARRKRETYRSGSSCCLPGSGFKLDFDVRRIRCVFPSSFYPLDVFLSIPWDWKRIFQERTWTGSSCALAFGINESQDDFPIT